MPEVTAAAIYIMRNPFDVAVSYARHANIPIDTMIDRMCDPINCGVSKEKILEAVGRWDNHIQSWKRHQAYPTMLCAMKIWCLLHHCLSSDKLEHMSLKITGGSGSYC